MKHKKPNGAELFDYSVLELLHPVELSPGIQCIMDGVKTPAPTEPQGVLTIHLARSYSFGTGGHPATRAALYALLTRCFWHINEENLHFLAGKRLLDYNCGSGILGIVLKKIFPGLDVWLAPGVHDWETAEMNNKVNGEEIKNLWVCDSDTTPTKLKRSFDYVLSHGGADSGIPEMATLTKQRGTIVLSGHEAHQSGDLQLDLMEWAHNVSVFDVENWPVLVGEKSDERTGGTL